MRTTLHLITILLTVATAIPTPTGDAPVQHAKKKFHLPTFPKITVDWLRKRREQEVITEEMFDIESYTAETSKNQMMLLQTIKDYYKIDEIMTHPNHELFLQWMTESMFLHHWNDPTLTKAKMLGGPITPTQENAETPAISQNDRVETMLDVIWTDWKEFISVEDALEVFKAHASRIRWHKVYMELLGRHHFPELVLRYLERNRRRLQGETLSPLGDIQPPAFPEPESK